MKNEREEYFEDIFYNKGEDYQVTKDEFDELWSLYTSAKTELDQMKRRVMEAIRVSMPPSIPSKVLTYPRKRSSS